MDAQQNKEVHACPRAVLDLIERFDLHAETYRRQDYNETQVRREFIDPFFAALGWDVNNEAGHAESYKDVIHEDAIKVGGSTKAPDYCFRIGGVRKFFVEAKKPSVSVGDNPAPAYQLRRYAWTNKLPLSIVTDFEELAVYDCRIRPRPDDKPSVARVLHLKLTEYPTKWPELASIFSKEAILKGSFDKYAESNKRKRGTTEVDDEFLKEIETWRDQLAGNIALRNPQLSVRDLNYAVGKIIDRIIFLRMCEDRGVETYAQLRILLNGPNVYPRLVELFHLADQRYNSGLFHFQPEDDRPDDPDTLTPSLTVDDKVLKDIIKSLYYPECPYEFSVFPPEILGQVYEQFLGKVIRLTKGHKAVVEEKPEVKKAGGVYYTPRYIVDYIVGHTVGELLKGKKPADIGPMLDQSRAAQAPGPTSTGGHKKADDASLLTKGGLQGGCLSILDPACGSGSFLLGAYQHLLDWHLRWYADNNPTSWANKKTPPIFESGSRGWQLTIAEKKRILLNSIFGVDIDPQAVEVTKLSLLLRVLEGESAESVGRTLRLFHERALPDLGDNIKCGNSLIGPDFYNGHQIEMFDEDERYRINVFDWNAEFPRVIRSGGFHAVIGNPPWGARLDQHEREYLSARHSTVADFESSQYFLHRMVKLTNGEALLGFIVPNTFALNVHACESRRSLLERTAIVQLADLSDVRVFLGPAVRSLIIVLSRKITVSGRTTRLMHPDMIPEKLQTFTRARVRDLDSWQALLVQRTPLSRLVDRLVQGFPTLDTVCTVRQGYIPYRTTTLVKRLGRAKAGEIVRTRAWHAREHLSSEYHRELQGADVQRYRLNWSGTWVRYGEWVSTYLPLEVFSGPRVLIREITGKPPHMLLAAYTDEVFVHNPSVLAVLPNPKAAKPEFILGILNSRLISLVFAQRAPKAKKGLFPKVIITDSRRLPFCSVDLGDRRRRSAQDRVVELVRRMLKLQTQRVKAKSPSDKTAVKRQIDATDRQIDQLVYELYGLSDDEIRIVESATEPPT